MFRIVILGYLVSSGPMLMAMPAQPAGLRIANALDYAGHALRVEMDDEAWNQSGIECGAVTALRRVKAGGHRLSFSCHGLEELNVRIRLDPGEIITLVAHRFQVDGKPMIRVLKLASMQQKNRTATLLHVGEEPRIMMEVKQLGKSWAPIAMKRFEPERLPISQHRGYLPMRVGKKSLPSMPVFESGNHVVVIYELQSGELATLSYRDRGWPLAEVQSSQP